MPSYQWLTSIDLHVQLLCGQGGIVRFLLLPTPYYLNHITAMSLHACITVPVPFLRSGHVAWLAVIGYLAMVVSIEALEAF